MEIKDIVPALIGAGMVLLFIIMPIIWGLSLWVKTICNIFFNDKNK